MTDELYDSLEGECKDSSSSSSLNLRQTESVSVKRFSNFESRNRHCSFSFGKDVNKGETHFFPSIKSASVNSCQKSGFFPANNKNPVPGLQELFNHSADYKNLAKKGLLLNRDGSFTKSNSDAEELPFITREYKNLVFQKQKTYNLKKKTSLRTKTKAFSEKETSECRSGGKYVESPDKNGILEDRKTKLEKSFSVNENLTDSMKLLQSQKKGHQHKIDVEQNPKYSFSETATGKDSFSKRNETKGKELKFLNKHLSQFDIDAKKQRLTYSERHQLQNGYSPLFLRRGIKKIASETARSNFGDSVTGKLSEVSSRVLSVEDLTGSEDEEKFYKEIIENDKRRAIKAAGQSIKVSGPGCAVESGSLKELEKLRGSGKNGHKQILKPLFIDIKNDGKHGNKKCSHYCSGDRSRQMSKTELALKGKTYGFLANARNILKFKSRVGEKLSGRENLNPKFNDSGFNQNQDSDLADGCKTSSFRLSMAKSLRHKLEEDFEKLRSADDDSVKGNGKGFYLPHITTSDHGDCKADSKNLIRMSSCLHCPVYQNGEKFTLH